MEKFTSNHTPISLEDLEHDGSRYKLRSTNTVFSGVAQEYYHSEQNAFEIVGMKTRTRFLNGRRHGLTENFLRNGSLYGGEIFNHGLLMGKFISDHCLLINNGLLYKKYIDEEEGILVDDPNTLFSGISRVYDDKNRLIRETSIVNGLNNGTQSHYDKNGGLRVTKQYVNNQLHGFYQCFDENQKLFHSSIFKHGFTKLGGSNQLVSETELEMFISKIEHIETDLNCNSNFLIRSQLEGILEDKKTLWMQKEYESYSNY